MGSLIGFIAVFGLAIRQTLSSIGRVKQLEAKKDGFDEAIVKRVMEERSAPVLYAAVGLAAFFLPFAFAGSIAGLEIAQPLAAVMLGGLITSTVYVLLGVPAMYLLFGKTKPEHQLQLDDVVDTPVSSQMAEGAA